MVERGIKNKHPHLTTFQERKKAELGNLAGMEFCGKRVESDGWLHFFFVYYHLGVIFVATSFHQFIYKHSYKTFSSKLQSSCPVNFIEKMNQPEKFQPSWPFYNILDSTLDQVELYGFDVDEDVCGYEFSSSISTTEDSSGIPSAPDFPTVISSEFVGFPGCDEALQTSFLIGDLPLNMEEFETILCGEIGDAYGWLDGSEESFTSQQQSTEGEDEWSPCPSTKSSEALIDTTSTQQSLTFPAQGVEIDNQQSILHLLKAYGEAVEENQRELSEVILRSICEKGNPLGETLERLAFNLFEDIKRQDDYLKQESMQNFAAAFKAFYQIFPYGRFAHFAANSAILEAMPGDVETVHIVDFDMGEGVQWPPMIEAIGKQHKAVRLTSIKWGEEDSCSASAQWRFEETKRWLCNHARSMGLNLTVEEVKIEDLVSEIKKMKKRGGRREWLAFNCMVRLPHMGRRRSRRKVMNFLRVARDIISNSANCSKGILTFGNGDPGEKMKNCAGYGAFFDGYLVHYQALMESMEWNFPVHLGEARTAMESLFVAPYVSSLTWFQNWEETREGCDLQAGTGWAGRKLSRENLMEAREMVKEGETSYRVNIEGQNENEMVLEWRGTPLVSLSTWR